MLKQRGINCEFLCVSLKEDGEKYKLVTQPLESSGIKVHHISSSKQLSFKLIKNMASVVKKGNYKLIHSNLIHSDIWMVLVKILFNRKLKIISTKHGYQEVFYTKYGLDPTKRMYNAFYFASKLVEFFIERSFAVSEGVRKVYIGLGIAKSDNIDTIHLGFKTTFTNFKPKYNTNRIMVVGRLVECKGHEYLLHAMQKIVAQLNGNVQLDIIGNGDHKAYLNKLSYSLGLNNNVNFLGFRTDVMELTQQADLMVIPSKSEGFGIVFLEAFEAKTPVIAFNVPACNEIIDDGINGYLIEPFDIGRLAESIVVLLTNEEKRKQFADAAHEKLTTVFTPEAMVDKTINFYNKVLEN